MHVGFTGTRKGLTPVQDKMLRRLIVRMEGDTVFHHGDCQGADEQFHDIVRNLKPNATIVIHPPESYHHRAYCYSENVMEAYGCLERVRDIVKWSDQLIGCPATDTEIKRGSGTWYTLRFAASAGVYRTIIGPKGKVTVKGLKGSDAEAEDVETVEEAPGAPETLTKEPEGS